MSDNRIDLQVGDSVIHKRSGKGIVTSIIDENSVMVKFEKQLLPRKIPNLQLKKIS